MDRFVMGHTIPEEVHALNSVVDIRTNLARIAHSGVVWKGTRKDRNPQRGQVRACAKESPEPKRQLGDDLAMRFLLTATSSCSIARCPDVVQRTLTVFARKEAAMVIPRSWPSRLPAMFGQCLIEGVAENDLDATDVLMERSAQERVPLVQAERLVEVATGRGEVGAQPLAGEPVGDHRWIGH